MRMLICDSESWIMDETDKGHYTPQKWAFWEGSKIPREDISWKLKYPRRIGYKLNDIIEASKENWKKISWQNEQWKNTINGLQVQTMRQKGCNLNSREKFEAEPEIFSWI